MVITKINAQGFWGIGPGERREWKMKVCLIAIKCNIKMCHTFKEIRKVFFIGYNQLVITKWL